MDNISHSVVGLATGELIHRSLPMEFNDENQRLRRRLLLLSCWLASNFPDLDLVLTHTIPAPLGYLLHHRGHTHTLPYALLQAFILGLMTWLCWPNARRLLKESKSARNGFMASIGVGLVLHIAMDYLNSYGVHPFYPLDARWFYGDMVFIVEPLFWIAFGVPMIMTLQRKWLRYILIASLGGLLLYFTSKQFLRWESFISLAIAAFAVGYTQHKANTHGRAALVFAILISVAFVGMQSVTSRYGGFVLSQHIKSKNASSRLLDTAMTAYPSNPLCWTFVSIETNEAASTYRLRRGILSVAPNILPIHECPSGFSGALTKAAESDEIRFMDEHAGDIAELQMLAKNNCYFEAWMRFARAPFVYHEVASDLRFSTGLQDNFSTLHLDQFKDQPCSFYIPGWDFPRKDLLTLGKH